VSGAALVLFPMLLFGLAMAWWELPTRTLRLPCQRLRLGRLNGHDMIWAICGLIGIAFASETIAGLALRVKPDLRVSPEFLLQRPGRHVLLFCSMDSVVRYQCLGRRNVLARLRSTAAGSGLRPRSMVAEWNDVVPIPLELWWAC
jgi:hypothetical protein